MKQQDDSRRRSGSPAEVAPERRRKAELKMRALAAAIRRFHTQAAQVHGAAVPGGILELEHIDPVINALDEALVAIRTLDLEVFEPSDENSYKALRESLPAGITVRGLTAPRNQAVHSSEVVDPDLERAVGPTEGGEYIIFPRWKPLTAMPREMFQYPHGKRRGEDQPEYMKSYETRVAGRLVLETLLDAYAFFVQCDSSVADRDSEGRLMAFPLPPLPVGGYVRLGPDWPDYDTVGERIRRKATAVPPGGQRREITGKLRSSVGTVYCGYTMVSGGTSVAFTEDAEQVVRDVRAGYVYVARIEKGSVPIQVDQGTLKVGEATLDDVAIPDWTDAADSPWMAWWDLCKDDANYYQRQRQPS